MAITVKGMSGQDVEVASKGVSNTALGLGIAGTTLGILNSGGILNGLLGGNTPINPMTGEATNGTACLVSKDLFYNTLIQQINENHANALNTEKRLSSIEAAVSQNAAISACNKDAIRREIEITNDTFDRTIANERVVNELILKNALCGTIKGTPVITPSQIGNTFKNPVHVIDSYVAREDLPGRRDFYGGQCGNAYGGYAPGWDGCAPCDGYRGF